LEAYMPTYHEPSITFTLDEIQEADTDCGGFCVSCGEAAYNVEPDARHYECEACEMNTVFGAQQIILEFPELIETDD
jgi:hypothetical protein